MTDKYYEIKTVDGNSVEIDRIQAREIYEAIKREYLIEDVLNVLEEDYESEMEKMQEEKSLDDFVCDVADEYDDVLSEDDSWRITLCNIVYEHYNSTKAKKQHKYEITIEDTVSGKITVLAEDEEQAEKIAMKQYKDGAVSLDTLICTQMMIAYEDGTESSFFEVHT